MFSSYFLIKKKILLWRYYVYYYILFIQCLYNPLKKTITSNLNTTENF